jgi:hypothetical protein
MSNPYGELIGQLEALKGRVEEPTGLMNAVSQASPLIPQAHQAKGVGEALLGEIPLPMDHPKWIEISGALMAAMGSIDGVIDYEQEVKQKAIDAVAALQQVVAEIDSAIRSFQQ